MLDRTDNPRAVIGGNQPPGAIELAEPTIEALRAFLTDNPVIGNEDEAREAKAILDRAIAALRGIDDERKSKVDPINAQVKEINTSYHKWHNASGKSGIWDKLLAELRSRMTAFAREEERRRQATAEAARARAEEEARKAREAAEALQRAQEDATMGVCEDVAQAVEQAEATAAAAIKADWAAQTAERQTHVRIGGGLGRSARFAAAGKERGNIITTDGRKYGLFREKISLCQVGGHYEAEVTDGQYCNIVNAKLIVAAAPVQQQPAPGPQAQPNGNGHGNGYYRPTSPVDAERMFVTATLGAFIKAGKIEPELTKVTNAITVLRQAYQRGFDDRVFTPSQAGHRHHLQAAE